MVKRHALPLAAAACALACLAGASAGAADAGEASGFTTIVLPNGVVVPQVALGVGYHGDIKTPNATGYNSTVKWLQNGGRHIDTAFVYNDESGVGAALRTVPRPRSDVFITTKMPGPLGAAAVNSYHAGSVKAIGVDVIDLYLVHKPSLGANDTAPADCGGSWRACRRETWAAMVALYKAGKARAVGVSNWAPQHLEDIADMMTPHVNQVELHPLLSGGAVPPTVDLVGYCRQRNITIMSYAALGGGAGPDRDPQSGVGAMVLSDPVLTRIAKAHGVSVAQVVIRWHLQRGFIADVRSEHVPHMLENLDGSGFQLTDDEVASVSALGDQPPVWFQDLTALP
mmetsp:Transcript_18751/g.66225  ORF Transcript_18751/g.66225 Transcript_18751/m.66225 type:complete len:341 (-) Transcript_18751:71-1093(-)